MTQYTVCCGYASHYRNTVTVESYGRFWVTTDQAAALWLISIISMPSRNLTPSMSLGN